MKLSQWAKKQGVTYPTAWRWFKSGKLPIPVERMPSGAIIVHPPEDKPKSLGKTYVYCRVSSHNKKDDLERQRQRCTEFCAVNGWPVEKSICEVASGMNDKRKNLMRLIDLRPERIVVEHKDRLTRFGFAYFDKFLPMLGCDLVVVNRDYEAKNDLMKDLVSVITSFCCRMYGMRRGKNKAAEIKKEIECDERSN